MRPHRQEVAENAPTPELPGRRPLWGTDRRLVRLLSGDFYGVEGRLVEVQVDVSKRLKPGFTIVGLPGKSTRESRDRIQAAVKNSGFAFPIRDRTTVNLAPAFQKHDGVVFDLPMALGILLATGQIDVASLDPGRLASFGFLGELGLDGELRPVPGALLIATTLRDRGIRRLVVPCDNAAEVAWASPIEVLAATDLHGAIAALQGTLEPFERPTIAEATGDALTQPLEFAEVRGQEVTKRGLLVAVAGEHHLLLVGPPGVGKTMLAERIPEILPPLASDEPLEVMKNYSASGLLANCLDRAGRVRRPFRAPHHTISYAGLVGGGNPPRPGEITLSHRGVLFLDELPEFSRSVLETLRQPMESGHIVISRSHGSVTFPANFFVIAAMNPCPCGYGGYPGDRCQCTPAATELYRRRVSGPLLDRIDLILEVAQPPARQVLGERNGASRGLSTSTMRERVLRARARQKKRWGQSILNSQVPQEVLLRQGRFSQASRDRLSQEAQRSGFSARSLGKLLRIARTLADLADSNDVDVPQILEAISLRRPAGMFR